MSQVQVVFRAGERVIMIPIAQPIIEDEEIDAVVDVLRSGQLAQGPRVRELENRFAESSGTEFAIATSSGTSALHIALLAHGIGPDDEVITTSFSFIASANCTLFVGAKPVFADIEPEYFTISPVDIARHITPKTRAIIPVHLFGQPCDMQSISKLAQEHDLLIIEDACQAHGAMLHNKPVGAFGTACYSLYATKNITTIEGGMITTNDSRIADRARLLRNHGSQQRYLHETLGYNLRMTDLQAAIGLAQLPKLKKWNHQRQNNAKYLTRKLSNIPGVVTPIIREGADHVFHQYTIRVSERDAVIGRLNKLGIGFGIYYPKPIHLQPLYLRLGYKDHLPHTEAACREVLSLPIHPSVSTDDLDVIAEALISLPASIETPIAQRLRILKSTS
jgi:perosamine synthetase